MGRSSKITLLRVGVAGGELHAETWGGGGGAEPGQDR